MIVDVIKTKRKYLPYCLISRFLGFLPHIAVKNAMIVLMGIEMNLYIALYIVGILPLLVLPVHEQGVSFCLFVSSLISSVS